MQTYAAAEIAVRLPEDKIIGENESTKTEQMKISKNVK